jgi:hypothetical protein
MFATSTVGHSHWQRLLLLLGLQGIRDKQATCYHPGLPTSKTWVAAGPSLVACHATPTAAEASAAAANLLDQNLYQSTPFTCGTQPL